MNMKRNLAALALTLTTATTWAQFPPQGGGGPMGQMQPMPPGGLGPMQFGKQFDPMKGDFFPPELIMQHQQELSLTDEQRAAIKEAMQKSIIKFTDLMWQQSSEQEAMDTLLKQEKLDEGKVLAQLDKLMGIEAEMKRSLFGMLVKVRNSLTQVQLGKLRSIRQTMLPPHQQGEQQGCPPPPKGHMGKAEGKRPGGTNAPPEPPPQPKPEK